MRRKSDRNKSKSSPEKKVDKPKRGRTSRRRRRSASSSPDPDSPSDEVTRDSKITVPAEPDNKEMHSKEVSPDADEDQMWHVKSAGGSSDTGEIQKLTICLSRPPSISDHSDKSPRARKKLDRSSSQTDSPSESPDDSKKNRPKSKRNSIKDVSEDGKDDYQRSLEINEESVTSSQEVCNINMADIVGVPLPPDDQVESAKESENNKKQIRSADNSDKPNESLIDKECDLDEVQGDGKVQPVINQQDSNEKSPVRKIIENNGEIDLNNIELPTSTVCINSNNADLVSAGESDPNKNTLCDTNEANAVDSTSKHEQLKASNTPEHVNHVQEGSHTPEQERSHTPDLKDKQPEILKVARQTSESSTVGQKKRRWGKTSKVSKATIVSISTDSLKNIISDVQPVGLDDCLLEESSKPPKETKHTRDPKSHKKEEKSSRKVINKPSESTKSMSHRKISITTNNEVPIIQRPPSPPQNTSSAVLFISNLVRPFTLAQLRNLLQRTGKIVENGFWIDKIKSKCYVEYENEDQAVETRHALHGVTWPVSNPKTLNVDFSNREALQSAVTSEDASVTIKGNSTGPTETWIKEQNTNTNNISALKDVFENPWDKRRTTVREWDLGKGEIIDERIERNIEQPDHNLDRRKRRSLERSPEPAKKFKKKDDEAPAKLLDDLFRKTKTTPCIYWLPLTAEMIKVKEEQRRLHMAEHERRMAELRRSRATAHQHPTHHRR